MSRQASLFRLVLSLVKISIISLVISVLFVSTPSPSPPSPMTSTKHIETTCVAEINSIIENNFKALNNIKNKKLEKKIEEYIALDNKKNLKKETCKSIAKNIITHSTFPVITTSIIFVESSYNKRAVNKYSGATGLGQIHPIHKKELKDAGIITSFSELTKIEPNVRAIEFVLQKKLKITGGNMVEALKLYSGNSTDYNERIWNKVNEINKYIKTS